MRSLRSVILLGLPLLAVGRPSNEQDDYDIENAQDFGELLNSIPPESLEAALAVNLAPKYREGVFEDGQDAMVAVHSDDPELATRLLDLAKQDALVKEYLRKRQDSNVTTTTSPVIVTDSSTTAVSFTTETTSLSATSASTTPTAGTTIPVTTTDDTGSTIVTSEVASSTIAATTPSPITTTDGSGSTVVSTPAAITSGTVSDGSSTATGVVVPVVVSSTDSSGNVVAQTTSAFQTTAPTSAQVAVTTTNAQGQTITTSSLAPAALVTTTNAQGSTITTASALSAATVVSGGSIEGSSRSIVTTTDSFGNTVVLSSPHSGQVFTTRDGQGHVVTITYTPGGGVVSQLEVQTTTLPDGSRSTITSFAVVGAGPTTGLTTPAPSGPASTSAKPKLQSGAATASSWYAAEIAVLIGAAVGVAGLVL